MKVANLMTRDCEVVRPATSLSQAAGLMWEQDCGALPVIDADRRAISMVTDRDICMSAYLEDKTLDELRVADAMSDRIVACRPDDDVTIAQEVMSEGQVRRLPVVDADGFLEGVLTLAQIALVVGDGNSSEVSKGRVGETLAAISRPTDAARAV